MTNDEKLMQQTLDALEEIIQGCHEVDDDDECIHKDAKDLARLVKIDCRKLANVLRARLAQPEPEPVAWASENVIPLRGLADNHPCILTPFKCAANTIPLYTAPPQREWQGLTDEEMSAAWSQSKGDILVRLKPFARAIEAKLKEKNAKES